MTTHSARSSRAAPTPKRRRPRIATPSHHRGAAQNQPPLPGSEGAGTITIEVAAKLLAARGKGDRLPDILVYSADEFAASTDDGGNLLVSTRTLRELESEDELAALLAHELSHLALRHNERKSALRNFPVGVETAGWVAAAGDRMQGNTGGAARRSGSSLDAFGGDALSNTQVASLLWSDVLMPGWSRAQEREADRSGFDMMRAAGYDPSAFGTLFSKLQRAQARRSERLQALQRAGSRSMPRARMTMGPSPR